MTQPETGWEGGSGWLRDIAGNLVHGIILVYGIGNVTLGGTQGGNTQDGYWWGGIAFAWALPMARAFSSGIIA